MPKPMRFIDNFGSPIRCSTTTDTRQKWVGFRRRRKWTRPSRRTRMRSREPPKSQVRSIQILDRPKPILERPSGESNSNSDQILRNRCAMLLERNEDNSAESGPLMNRLNAELEHIRSFGTAPRFLFLGDLADRRTGCRRTARSGLSTEKLVGLASFRTCARRGTSQTSSNKNPTFQRMRDGRPVSTWKRPKRGSMSFKALCGRSLDATRSQLSARFLGIDLVR